MSGRLLQIEPQSLAALVTAAIYERGLSVYRNQQVLDFHAEVVEQGWEITGAVRGSGREVYEVYVALDITSQGRVSFFTGECTCPVASNCKHSVALLLKALYKSTAVRVVAPPAAPQTEQALQAQREAAERSRREQALRLAERQVVLWLDSFDRPAGADEPDQLVAMLIPSQRDRLPKLRLGLGYTRRLRNGNWGKVKVPNYLSPEQADEDEADLMRFVSALAHDSYRYSSPTQCEPGGRAGLQALRLAADSGRLFSLTDERVLGRAIAWGPPRTLDWSWEQAPGEAGEEPWWTLRPRLGAAGGRLTWFANSPPLYLDLDAGLCGLLETPGLSSRQMDLLLKAPPMPPSALASHEAELVRRLGDLPPPPGIQAPELVHGLAALPCLHVARVPADEAAALGLLRAEMRFEYGSVSHASCEHTNPLLVERSPGGGRVRLHRDLAAEAAALAALHALGLQGDAAGRFHLAPRLPQALWLQWLDTDFSSLREAGWQVTVDPALAGWIARADTLDVELAGLGGPDEDLAGGDDSRSPWFDLSLGVSIGGQRHNILPLLPLLLAYLSGPGTRSADGGWQLPAYAYLPRGEGGYLRLPTEPLRPWLQALLELVGERGGRLEGESVRLSRLEALRVGAALGEGARWQGADGLRQMVRQLAGLGGLPAVAPPEGLRAQLRPYQQQGLEWLQFLRTHGLAGILADDMGLGKTLQTLAHVLAEKQAGRLDRPALVIAPVSLMGNWRREAERFTPELRTLVLHGNQRHEAAAAIAQHDLVIAPYSLLQRDRERWLGQAWHLVVLDEAQNIKNAKTHAAQIVGSLDTRHRLCLSGTPMENHLGELWSLFHFLMPGFLGSQGKFNELFRTPIEKQGDVARMDHLRRRVTPFILRRAKGDVARELPEKLEAVTSVELGEQQADLYETIRLATEQAVRQALADRGLAKSQIQVLDALLKLRQVCCDPRLVPLAAARKVRQSAKLELLMELLPEMLAEGRRVLLFSQFTSMLELIEQELARRDLAWVKLTGQSQRRDELIERFTSGAVPLFLISLKAGGVGLNLTQADTVIHYDPWWNPAAENQATDRAHRIGQTERVLVYKLVAQGTIEERILALQERKAALADSLYGAATARKQPLFTEDDLSELLRPLG